MSGLPRADPVISMTSLRPYAQLVRLPNLPTALADIGMAGLATGASDASGKVASLPPAAAGNACLYQGGMVWNDFFDVAQDVRERPHRPIPSGQVSRRQAGWIGAVLLAGGVLLAFLAGWVMVQQDETASLLRPVIVAGLLVVAILLYDAWLKHTWLGPVAMGSCRFLNVLLGVTVSGSLAWPLGPHLAGVVGLYIVGVTWFARTEARMSNQSALAGAAAVMLAALILAVPLPVHRPADTASPLFVPLLVVLGFVVGLPVSRAVASPTPERVQAGVKRGAHGIDSARRGAGDGRGGNGGAGAAGAAGAVAVPQSQTLAVRDVTRAACSILLIAAVFWHIGCIRSLAEPIAGDGRSDTPSCKSSHVRRLRSFHARIAVARPRLACMLREGALSRMECARVVKEGKRNKVSRLREEAISDVALQ